MMRRAAITVILASLFSVVIPAYAQRLISFPTIDGGRVYADIYGSGVNGVVLAHGGRFDKSTWRVQAERLHDEGCRVLAIDFRGYGASVAGTGTTETDDGLRFDIMAAVVYLRDAGATTVSVVEASMGGGAAAEAASVAIPGEIDRLVLLAHSLVAIQEQYRQAPEPKELVVLEGSAHAQYIFETDQGDRLMEEIVRFLVEP